MEVEGLAYAVHSHLDMGAPAGSSAWTGVPPPPPPPPAPARTSSPASPPLNSKAGEREPQPELPCASLLEVCQRAARYRSGRYQSLLHARYHLPQYQRLRTGFFQRSMAVLADVVAAEVAQIDGGGGESTDPFIRSTMEAAGIQVLDGEGGGDHGGGGGGGIGGLLCEIIDPFIRSHDSVESIDLVAEALGKSVDYS